MDWVTFMEVGGALNGTAGAWLLAFNCKGSKFGWVLFLLSNLFWLTFAVLLNRHWMLLQTVSFTLSSTLGVWNYVVVDRYPSLQPVSLPRWAWKRHA